MRLSTVHGVVTFLLTYRTLKQYKIFLQKVIVSTQKLTKVLTEYENEQCVQ